MTTLPDETLERRLVTALATVPAPAGVDRLDEHVRRAVMEEGERRARSRPSGRRRALVLGSLGFLVAAGALTAAAGGSTLLDRLMSNGEGPRTAWALAEPLGLHATIAEQDVTLERAYLDANEFVFGLSTTGDLRLSVEEWVDGRTPEEWGVQSAGSGRAPGNARSGEIYRMTSPPDTGAVATVVLQVRERGTAPIGDPTVERPGRFAFELPNHGGGRLSRPVTITGGGVVATLDALIVAPASIEGHMSFDVSDWPVSVRNPGWSSTSMELLHDGQRIDAAIGVGDDGSGGFNVVQGVVDWSGDWTIRVDGLTRFSDVRPGDGPSGSSVPLMETIEGPWVFELTLAP